ncbi:response regulator [Chitinophaga vietnamensis]|uniref:response regulator n=1 Tax=Chitinophaga vietnamensis TaxID=2593957 RepID=UPI00117895EE|nr:response regulator [Chitinophaga vietnamensis]
MNNELKILAVGYNEAIMEVILRLLNKQEGWSGKVALSRDAAESLFRSEPFDAVLLCAGVSKEEGQELRELFKQLHPQAKVIRHYGGGSGLLENEIRAAFEHNK